MRRFLVAAALFVPAVAFAQDAAAPQAPPVDLAVTVGNLIHVQTIGQYIVGVYTYGLGIAATLAMVMVVVGGFQYMVARGNPSAIGAAKSRITNAVIGLILALGSYALLNTINPQLVRLREISVPPISAVANPVATANCIAGTNNCRCIGDGAAGTCTTGSRCVATQFIFWSEEEIRGTQAIGGAIGLASPIPGGALAGALIGTFVNLGHTEYRCSNGRAGSPCGDALEDCRDGLVCEVSNFHICINATNNVNGSPCTSDGNCASDNCAANQCRGAGERLTTEAYIAAGYRIPASSQCALNGDCRQEQTACLKPGGSTTRFCYGDSAYWSDNTPTDGTLCFLSGGSAIPIPYPADCGQPHTPLPCMFCPTTGDRRWTMLDSSTDPSATKIGSCKPRTLIGTRCGD